MGYISTVTGEISATIPENKQTAVLKALDTYMEDKKGYGAHWIVEYGFQSTERLYVDYSEIGKAYSMEDDINEVITIIKKHDGKANGNIHINGEDFHDYSIIEVKDNQVKRHRGRIKVMFEEYDDYYPDGLGG